VILIIRKRLLIVKSALNLSLVFDKIEGIREYANFSKIYESIRILKMICILAITLMVINWYGEGCFKIQTGGITLLTDPFDSSVGLTPPRFKSDIVIKTTSDYPIPYNHQGVQTEVLGPGEYEIKGVEIFGWPIFEKQSADAKGKILKTIYLVKVEDLNLGLLGAISEMPTTEILEELGHIDLLLMPAGGAPYISQELAAKLIKQINPKIVVASYFKIPDLKSKVSDIKDFLEETGYKAEPQEKLTVKKKELPAATQLFVPKI